MLLEITRAWLFAHQRRTNLVELGGGLRAAHRGSSQVSCRIGLTVLFELGREPNPRGAVLDHFQEKLEKRALVGPDRELAALLGLDVDVERCGGLQSLTPDPAPEREREERSRRALAALGSARGRQDQIVLDVDRVLVPLSKKGSRFDERLHAAIERSVVVDGPQGLHRDVRRVTGSVDASVERASVPLISGRTVARVSRHRRTPGMAWSSVRLA